VHPVEVQDKHFVVHTNIQLEFTKRYPVEQELQIVSDSQAEHSGRQGEQVPNVK
jgi:hypothetical protein